MAVTVPDAPGAVTVQPDGTSMPAVFAGHGTAVGSEEGRKGAREME